MVYCSTGSMERLYFHPNNDLTKTHWVDMEMSNCDSTFAVTICCDENWVWEFYYDKTNYDLVKHVIMDCIFEAENIDELIETMDEAFEEFFDEIVVYEAELLEDECEINCGGDCDNCVCNAINGCDAVDNSEKTEGVNIDEFILAELEKINNKLDKGV